MFFFFFDNDLRENVIVQSAFYSQCFKKLVEVGYCDMNIYFGRPKIKRETIAYNLELRKSSLVKLFRSSYPHSLEEATQNIQEVLEEMIWNEKSIDEYSEFAIVYYIYKSLNTNEKKEEFTREILRGLQENKYEVPVIAEKTMDLRLSHGIIFDNNEISLEIINTMNQYMGLLERVSAKGQKLFFRGHSDISYRLTPSIFRKKEWLRNEKLMYQELQINCASEFSKKKGHLEILAEMQHYGLPTRLLDITNNPLIALYFSCENVDNHSGEVVILGIEREKIKYPQSDTVAVLSSLPLFTFEEQKEFYELSNRYYHRMEDFNYAIERLVQEVRIERPGFVSKIRQEDLRKSVVVIPSRNNRRIEKQEGAFIICGLLDEKYGRAKTNSLDSLRVRDKDGKKLVCVINDKARLMKQLNALGINKSKIYPEIDDVADYIKNNIADL